MIHILPGDPPIEVELRRSPRARRLTLRVSRLDGRVTLTAPRGVPEDEALAFARSRYGWLAKQQSQQPQVVQVGFGTALPLEGVPRQIVPGTARRAAVDDTQIAIWHKTPAPGAAVEGVVKARARDRLTEASHYYARLLGRRVGSVTLRDTRSRWGSCSATGGLSYSWRLILAPPDVLDYVAAHEAAHLVEMNHSAAYWDVVAGIFPDHQVQRRWLREHGATLHCYRFRS